MFSDIGTFDVEQQTTQAYVMNIMGTNTNVKDNITYAEKASINILPVMKDLQYLNQMMVLSNILLASILFFMCFNRALHAFKK